MNLWWLGRDEGERHSDETQFSRRGYLGRLASVLAVAPGIGIAGALGGPRMATAQSAARDIVDTAVAAGHFGTLARALTAGGLVETLKGAGPFTVFAPTDEAFAKVPADQLNALLANVAALRSVLTYHVVGGRVPASQVVGLTSASTVQGEPVAIGVRDGGVYLNGTTRVTETDIAASNGIIHVIDSVILPPSIAPRTVARDGQSLETQPASAQALFRGTWGDRAAARWVEEHEMALERMGR
jgi:uncharacterized surface protein with fasciclin (FAS1) repeats